MVNYELKNYHKTYNPKYDIHINYLIKYKYLKQQMVLYKFNNNKQISKPLADLIYKNKIYLKLINADNIIYPPLSTKKQIVRGYNQIEEILKQLEKISGNIFLDKVLNVLEKKDITLSKLKQEQRYQVVDLFDFVDCDINLNFKNVVLIDDIVTTGTTINSIATILKNRFENIHIEIFCICYEAL